MKITKKDVYTIFAQFLIHAESISWSRFNNFLIINSILVLAWATIFASEKCSLLWGKCVMTVICGLGVLSTICWADLGKRGRAYVKDYKDRGESIEKEAVNTDWWEEPIDDKDLKPFTVHEESKPYSSSYFLLGYGPYFFIIIYVLLLLATWLVTPIGR